MQTLIEAFKYLTILGRFMPKPPLARPVGAVAVYFPLVGLVLGLLLALANYVLRLYLDSQLLSIFLTGFLVLATGAAHCDGLKKTCDALLANRFEPLNGRQTAFGSIAVTLLILVKLRAIELIEEKIALSLLLTPIFARWTLVISLFGYQDRCADSARWIADRLNIWHVLLTTSLVLGLAYYFLARKGLWIGLCLSVLALFARSLLQRRHGELTEDHFGATIELSEMIGLILLASL
jgi:adenosylcobinamide-GDP ribazoletransferase